METADCIPRILIMSYCSDPPENSRCFSRFLRKKFLSAKALKNELYGANTLAQQVCCAQRSVLTLRSNNIAQQCYRRAQRYMYTPFRGACTVTNELAKNLMAKNLMAKNLLAGNLFAKNIRHQQEISIFLSGDLIFVYFYKKYQKYTQTHKKTYLQKI